ncbi:MAG: hypothetical protein FWG90_01460 [Oscillospiraceae bacterium]|nr:hypothetical protein [Oscillospiraceae bacterium]
MSKVIKWYNIVEKKPYNIVENPVEMTYTEIVAKYSGQYVLIVNVVYDLSHRIISGVPVLTGDKPIDLKYDDTTKYYSQLFDRNEVINLTKEFYGVSGKWHD